VGGLGGLAAGVRRGRRRRGRPKEADPATDGPEVPITRVTIIRPGAFADREGAESWLRATGESEERRDELVAEAVGLVNRALHAHRLATQDPDGGGVSAAYALATRIGFGSGDELADGRWAEAIEVPGEARPRARTEALRPQERLAATLGRREAPNACETLLLRARADLNAERTREAALQLRVGLEALLAEVKPDGGALDTTGAGSALASDQAAAQIADLEALSERRTTTGEAANEALAGELSATRAEEVGDTLRLCERVLRRRRILAR
jgi:hypothetical protein